MYDTYFLIIYNDIFSIPNVFRLSTAQTFVVQGRNKIHAPSKDAENTQWDRKSMSQVRKLVISVLSLWLSISKDVSPGSGSNSFIFI